MKSEGYNRSITAACIAGILISTYALYVEMAVEARPGYKALCDLAEHAQCSRVLTSEFAKGFGVAPKDSIWEVPNCVYGILFYCIIIFLATFNQEIVVKIQLVLAAGSVLSCIYLGYLLAFVLHDFCVVCVSTYVVNIVVAVLVHRKHKLIRLKKKLCGICDELGSSVDLFVVEVGLAYLDRLPQIDIVVNNFDGIVPNIYRHGWDMGYVEQRNLVSESCKLSALGTAQDIKLNNLGGFSDLSYLDDLKT